MKYLSPLGRLQLAGIFFLGSFAAMSVHAAILDTVGVTLLRQVVTNLDGTGIRVAQVESIAYVNTPPPFEVDPNNAQVGLPASRFDYISSSGSTNGYPNNVGLYSSHATAVGGFCYGLAGGVATNVVHVDNYEANYFINNVIFDGSKPAIDAKIVNQSYIFGDITTPQQISYDQQFDDYADLRQVLFISGVGNADSNYYNGAVNVPASCYNGIGVAAFGTVNSSVGPTVDNGRCKPDITAPNEGAYLVTSYTTPLVSGSAALLRQAALRGAGGNDTNSASDMRTLKALLLNGALKPVGWTNGPSTPLDARHGAGILNVFNSYMQLAGGQSTAIEQTTVSIGNPHPSGSSNSNITNWSGWSLASLSSTSTPPPGKDTINHHYFNLTNPGSSGTFTATATLVWNRQNSQTAINDLDLFLYDTANSNLIAESISGVDNVEHLYIPSLPPGRYDLQVWKAGGSAANGRVTSSQTYALAWEFFSMPLAVAQSGTNVVLSWPIYPTGFTLESSTSQSAPFVWSTLSATPVVTNGTNHVTLGMANTSRWFRLRRP